MNLLQRIGVPQLLHQQLLLGLPLEEVRPRRVLFVGTPPRELWELLETGGCQLGIVPGVGGAFYALRDHAFDAVVLDEAAEKGLALKLVASLKLGAPFPGMGAALIGAIASRTASVPFFIVPPEPGGEFALLRAPGEIWLRGGGLQVLADVLLRLGDAGGSGELAS